ncbi:MAG: addiction module toxin RelE [Chloroflexi bacterium]|nr:MAG: addiction module toxin RelE [Chloroflexota bacterium]
MPKAWSNKDERMYEHIKEGSEERGVSEDRAEEIAARTVNKRRRMEGRTPNRRTQGTGNPNRGLESRSRDEVYNRAKEMNIEGRSKMTKAELVDAIRHSGGRG